MESNSVSMHSIGSVFCYWHSFASIVKAPFLQAILVLKPLPSGFPRPAFPLPLRNQGRNSPFTYSFHSRPFITTWLVVDCKVTLGSGIPHSWPIAIAAVIAMINSVATVVSAAAPSPPSISVAGVHLVTNTSHHCIHRFYPCFQKG